MNDKEAIEELEGYAQNHSNFDEEVREAIDVVLDIVENQKEKLKLKQVKIKDLAAENDYLKALLYCKDKQIDLMAKYLSIVVDCPYETEGVDMNCKDTCEFGKDEECWKIYFENKVKESK